MNNDIFVGWCGGGGGGLILINHVIKHVKPNMHLDPHKG
jgi:hypothetical protein